MTSEERNSILDMMLHRISEEEFLRRFRIRRVDGSNLALRILEEAYRQKDAHEVESGLGVGFHFGMTLDHLDILCRLSDADWHIIHEDIVTALGKLRDVRAVEPLYRASLKLHPYLDFDDARALAVKAIWALGGLKDPLGDEKLRLLARSENEIVKENARDQLRHRRQTIAYLRRSFWVDHSWCSLPSTPFRADGQNEPLCFASATVFVLSFPKGCLLN
jgi:hypothetical protein